MSETKATVSIDVIIYHPDSLVLSDIINDLNYDISSDDDEVIIVDTEMWGWNFISSDNKNIKIYPDEVKDSNQ